MLTAKDLFRLGERVVASEAGVAQMKSFRPGDMGVVVAYSRAHPLCIYVKRDGRVRKTLFSCAFWVPARIAPEDL